MKQTVTLQDFREAFYKRGRKDQFSYEGLEVLFTYIEGEEQRIGEEIDMDVIALCRDYAESTIDDLINDYDIVLSDCDIYDEDDIKEVVLEYMEQNTVVCGVTSNGTVVFAQRF